METHKKISTGIDDVKKMIIKKCMLDENTELEDNTELFDPDGLGLDSLDAFSIEDALESTYHFPVKEHAKRDLPDILRTPNSIYGALKRGGYLNE